MRYSMIYHGRSASLSEPAALCHKIQRRISRKETETEVHIPKTMRRIYKQGQVYKACLSSAFLRPVEKWLLYASDSSAFSSPS